MFLGLVQTKLGGYGYFVCAYVIFFSTFWLINVQTVHDRASTLQTTKPDHFYYKATAVLTRFNSLLEREG